MASEKKLNAEPPILAEIKKRAYPILDTRPPDSLSMKEMAAAVGVSVDVIRRQLQEMRAAGALREARVRMARGGYTVVYWLE